MITGYRPSVVRVDNREFCLKVNNTLIVLEHNPCGMPKSLTLSTLRRYYAHIGSNVPAAMSVAVEFAMALPPGRYIDVEFQIPGTQDFVHVIHNDHSEYCDPLDDRVIDPYTDMELIVQ